MVRLQDKLSRIRSIVEAGGVMEVEEALLDTFADVINYTAILAGLVWEDLDLPFPWEDGSDPIRCHVCGSNEMEWSSMTCADCHAPIDRAQSA